MIRRFQIQRRSCVWLALGALCLVLAGTASAQSGRHPPAPVDPTRPPPAPPETPLVSVSPGVYELGMIRLDKNTHTVRFPGAVNMKEHAVEYWLVASGGKLHESVFRTEVEPIQIHLAMLLIGAKGNTNQFHPGQPFEVSGDEINISVLWQGEEGVKKVAASETVLNLETESRMSSGPWTYNGSRMIQGFFLAQRDRSIVAVIADPDALVNNPRPGRENDLIWEPNPEIVPEPGTPVEIIFQLQTESENAGKEKETN